MNHEPRTTNYEPPALNTPISRRKLYLMDAMALAYRAHFIFISRPLINSRGMNTSATYGFTTAVLKLLEDEKPDYLAVVFDDTTGEKTFRDEMFEAYKANRPPMPDGLRDGLPLMKEIVRAMDIPLLEIPGVEADDVIGTMAREAEREGLEVVIVSPDKDFQQLLTAGVVIMRPAHRGEQFDPITLDSFRKKFGVEPEQFIDVLALIGDTSDNVPGVPGIGEKTAPQLIQEYGSIENLIAKAEEIKAKRVREGLLQHRDQALLSKQLVTIKTDVPLGIDWNTLQRHEPHMNEVKRIFEDLEFRNLWERAVSLFQPAGDGQKVPPVVPEPLDPQLGLDFGPGADVAVINTDNVSYRTIRNAEGLHELADALDSRHHIAFDTETTSRDEMLASLVGCSISVDPDQAWYVPTPMQDGSSTEEVLEVLRTPLANKSIRKVGHNLKYDIIVLSRHGLDVKGSLFDTMVAHYLVEPEEPHNLDALARKYLNYQKIPISDLIGTGRSQLSMRDVPIDSVCTYACEDADVSLKLEGTLRKKLAEDGLLQIAEEIEFPLIYVLAEMEETGVRIDTDVLSLISKQLTLEIQRLETEVFLVAGEPFNIGSPKQLGEILFSKLGLKTGRKTATGQASTNERVLQQLATEHPLPGLVLDWRHLSKLKGTYVDSLALLIHPETGRIHTSFNQTIAATGRLSSSSPNLQNIPVRSEIGREIRSAFIPDPGFQMMTADYVQIELRIIASMSGDEDLKRAFSEGQDIHTVTAARVFNLPTEEVTRDMRRKAKEVNYGIPYGISAFELAQRLRMPVRDAQTLIDEYHRSYPAISRLLNRLVEQAQEKGYVETPLGRRRYLPNINARNRSERGFAERAAVNMPIQGTQADMIKIAMVRIHERIKAAQLKSKMILQVHDELVFEVHDDEQDTMKEIVRNEMVSAHPLDVPVEVEIGVGKNWLDAH